jgi:hypothetical protein
MEAIIEEGVSEKVAGKWPAPQESKKERAKKAILQLADQRLGQCLACVNLYN